MSYISKDSIVSTPSRSSMGKKIDTWDVRFPDNEDHKTRQLDVFMRRDDENRYYFYVKMPDSKYYGDRLEADTPTELIDLVNAAVAADIKKTWTKKIQVEFESYNNHDAEPEEQGDHELSMSWYIVYVKPFNKGYLILKDGETVFPTWDKDNGKTVLLDWTQHREDVIRTLAVAIHKTHDALQEFIHEKTICSKLDAVPNGRRLLTGGVNEKSKD